MTELNILKFENFPLTWGIITIPQNSVFYRTGDTDPSYDSIPRWFADFETSLIYKHDKPNRDFYMCRTKKPIKLVDLRFLKYMFLEDVSYKNKTFTPGEKENIKEFLFALGCMNFNEQFEMLQKMDDYVQCFFLEDKKLKLKHAYWLMKSMGKGQRISVSTIDAKMVKFFKDLYTDIDGYIAPRIETPWHTHFHQEICLFEPSSVLQDAFVILDEHLKKFKYDEKQLLGNANIIFPKMKIETPIFIKQLILTDHIPKDHKPLGTNPDYIGGSSAKSCKVKSSTDYMLLRDEAMEDLNYREICKNTSEKCKIDKDIDKTNKTLKKLVQKMK